MKRDQYQLATEDCSELFDEDHVIEHGEKEEVNGDAPVADERADDSVLTLRFLVNAKSANAAASSN